MALITCTTAFAKLEAAFNCEAVREVPFNPEWANGTGYYNGAQKAELSLAPGEIVKSRDVEPNNRRMLIIGTPVGNVVIFERYTPGTGSSEIVVGNMPRAVSDLVRGGSALDAQSVEVITGIHDYFNEYDLLNLNVGHKLNAVVKAALQAEAQ